MAKIAIGIDIGGTGIKGALVDVKNGEMIGDRVRVETPEGGSTDDIIATVKALLKKLPDSPDDTPIGICFPAVVQHGVTKSAANISKKWIGFDADRAFAAIEHHRTESRLRLLRQAVERGLHRPWKARRGQVGAGEAQYLAAEPEVAAIGFQIAQVRQGQQMAACSGAGDACALRR